MEPAKRQKLDPIQLILGLDPDLFHEEFQKRKSSVRNARKLRGRLSRKLAMLQDLLYSEEPLPTSPQTYEVLEFRRPLSAELVARRNGQGDSVSTRVRTTVEKGSYGSLNSKLRMHKFCDEGHRFQNIRVIESNAIINTCVKTLLENGALDNLEIRDTRLLKEMSSCWNSAPSSFPLKKLMIADCRLETIWHAKVIRDALTSDDSTLHTLELKEIGISKEACFGILEGIWKSKCLQNLRLSHYIHCADKDFFSLGLPQAIAENQSLTTISGDTWKLSIPTLFKQHCSTNFQLHLKISD